MVDNFAPSPKLKCQTCGEQYPRDKMNSDTECKACAYGENQL